MKNKFLLIGGMISALLLLAVYIPQTSKNQGSVDKTNEYKSATTLTMTAASSTQVFSRSGTLGSIVISSSTAGTLELRDATSSTDVASTSIAKFPANASVGTYTFDISLYRGLSVILGSGFNGSYSITYR